MSDGIQIGEILFTEEHPILIGVGGLKESGKDAFASVLEEKHHFVRRGMSDPLVEFAIAENPWIRISEDDPEEIVARTLSPDIEVFSVTSRADAHAGWLIRAKDLIDWLGYVDAKRIKEFRVYLQKVGTECVREIVGQESWVNVATDRIMGDIAFGRNVVMTAIRFENELQMIKDLGGASFWIERPEITAKHEAAVAASSGVAQHSSEVTLTAADFPEVVLNDGSLEDLAQIATFHYELLRAAAEAQG